MARTILVIDDEDNMRWVLDRALKKAGYEVMVASRGDEGLRLFARHAVDLVLLDLKMPGMDGLSVLRELRQRNSQIPILLLTAYATVATAVEALKIGATDYVRKPFDLEELQTKISNALYASTEPTPLIAPSNEPSTINRSLIGISPAIVRIQQLVEAASKNDYPVLIHGEIGSGRRKIARLLHDCNIIMPDGKLVFIDCDALPESVVKKELGRLLHGDGHGSREPTVGELEQWEKALGGTLVLANFDALPPNIADKFLHNVQAYLRSPTRPNGLRVILTLQEAPDAQWASFLAHCMVIETSPLRNQPEDIPLLIAHFAPNAEWSAAAYQVLNIHDWPGNVSELQQIISYALTLSNGQPVDVEHLPPALRLHSKLSTGSLLVLPKAGINLEEFEKNLIEQALTRTSGNKTQAAKLLNISRSTLHYRLTKHGLEDDSAQHKK